jgi:DNA repair protein SbcD/Mre11
MPLKIFHTSDLHLGMKFSRYPEVQQELSEARFLTLRSLIERANKEGCQLFVIAGDLFDRVSVAKRDVLRAASILREFAGNAVVVLPGNHDFVTRGQVDLWSAFKEDLPDNGLLLDEEKIYSLRHYDLDADLYAAPCHSKHSSINAVNWIKEIEKDRNVTYHVGIAHGSLEGVSPDFDQSYYPMSESELVQFGADVWLLGHTHIQYPSKPGSRNRVFFAGTPEPDGFDCQHPGLAWLIELGDDKAINPVSIPTGSYRFLYETTAVSCVEDVERLEARYAEKGHERDLLKLRLRGTLARAAYADLADLRAWAQKWFLYCDVDYSEVAEEIEMDVINSEFAHGSFPHRLLTLLSEAGDTDGLKVAYEMVREVRK